MADFPTEQPFNDVFPSSRFNAVRDWLRENNSIPSGTEANRPVITGSSSAEDRRAGRLYYAIDTRRLWRWDGSTWRGGYRRDQLGTVSTSTALEDRWQSLTVTDWTDYDDLEIVVRDNTGGDWRDRGYRVARISTDLLSSLSAVTSGGTVSNTEDDLIVLKSFPFDDTVSDADGFALGISRISNTAIAWAVSANDVDVTPLTIFGIQYS